MATADNGELMALSGFLRYSLARAPDERVSLREEAEAQEEYLRIEQARFDPSEARRLRAVYELGLGEDRFRLEVAGDRLGVGRGSADGRPGATRPG